MSDEEKRKDYELVLKNISDQSPRSIQKIKGILVGDMELSIEDAQKILTSFPLTIKRSDSELDLNVHYKSLKAAGAEVLLLKPAKSTGEVTAAQIDIDNDNDSALFGEQDDNSIEFEIDLESDESLSKKKEPPPVSTFELNIDDEQALDLANIEKELQAGLEEKPGNSGETAGTQEPQQADNEVEFSLELMPAETGKELLESPALSNMPDDNGEFEAENLSQSLVAQTSHGLTEPAETATTSTEPNLSLIESALQLEAAENEEKDPEKTEPSAREVTTAGDAGSESILERSLSLDEQVQDKEPHVPEESLNKNPAEGDASESMQHATSEESTREEPGPEVPVIGHQKLSEQVNPKKPKKSAKNPEDEAVPLPSNAIGKDTIIAISVGVVLLGVVNWFYFSSQNDEDGPQKTIVIPDEAVKANAVNGAAPKILPEDPTFNYIAEYDSEELKASLNIDANSSRIKSASLELSTAKPAALTPEEIVQGKSERVWLKKAESEKFTFEKIAEGNFVGTAPIRLYTEQGSKRNRLIGSSHLLVKQVSELKLEVVFTVSLNVSDLKEGETLTSVETGENGSEQILIRKTLDLVRLSALTNG